MSARHTACFTMCMKRKCPYCIHEKKIKSTTRTVLSIGRYWRKSDGQWIQRFWCKRCSKSYSSSFFKDNYKQKKRHKNEIVRRALCAGVSQREAARILNLNRKTIVRKFRYYGSKQKVALLKYNEHFPPAAEVEFDDLETIEHTKLKPLSVTLMVEYKTRRILGFEVSQMPAKGLLATRALKKYGVRKDGRRQARRRLFESVQKHVLPTAVIRSDSNPHYVEDVRSYFPQARHETVLGGRGAITGQGELKKLKFDPLFSLNHTCAMLRANINRLFRKTWCTTKDRERLRDHIAIYAMSHNRRLSTA